MCCFSLAILSDSHATSISPGWLMFGYNGYTIIIAIAALIIVLLICIIIFLLFRRSSKATAASNAVDQAYDGNEVDGAEDDGSGYPPPGAKGPFKIFKSRFRGGGKIQKSYPQRPGKYSSAPYKSGGTGESQIGGAGDEEGGEPYDQEGTGESGYGAMGQNEEATYQEEYPPQGYGRGLKSRAPFRGGRTGSALPPKYPPPFQTKRKKAPYQTLKQSGGPGRFPRPPAKRGLFGIGRGGRGYGAPGQY
uniref:Uncharacterized protein n=1 Tax=Romanomermis culicivorax TaxID=13658 RepID=A0A915IMY9_ROMCU